MSIIINELTFARKNRAGAESMNKKQLRPFSPTRKAKKIFNHISYLKSLYNKVKIH